MLQSAACVLLLRLTIDPPCNAVSYAGTIVWHPLPAHLCVRPLCLSERMPEPATDLCAFKHSGTILRRF